MVVSFILHFIAATLWMLSALIAISFSHQLEKPGHGSSRIMLSLWCIVVVIAFTLQVIA